MPPKFEVEDARPDKGEEAAGEVSYEAHQDGEVGDEDGKQDGDHDHTNSKTESPDLEFAIEGYRQILCFFDHIDDSGNLSLRIPESVLSGNVKQEPFLSEISGFPANS